MAQDERQSSAAGLDDGPVDGEEGVLRTFLIADVRGYTRYTNERGDEAGADLARRFADGARAAVTGSGGEVVELRGDEALCVFTSPRQAVRGAVALQRRLRAGENGQPGLPLGVGVGIDAGEAVPIEGGYRGSALNVAARLCSLAGPGEILATETLRALAGPVPGVE
jgi:adenylate cyclase